MTEHVTIAGKFGMDLPEAIEDNGWWGKWAIKGGSGPDHHIRASLGALLVLRRCETLKLGPSGRFTAWEPFAGIGAQALLVDDVFTPDLHILQEQSLQATDHLFDLDLYGSVVLHGDSYKTDVPLRDEARFTLTMADFGDLTAHKAFSPGKHKDFLETIFEHSDNVVLTDICGQRFYLPGVADAQARAIGVGGFTSYEPYLASYAAKIERTFGFHLVAGFPGRWSSIMAFTRHNPEPGVSFPRFDTELPDVPGITRSVEHTQHRNTDKNGELPNA